MQGPNTMHHVTFYYYCNLFNLFQMWKKILLLPISHSNNITLLYTKIHHHIIIISSKPKPKQPKKSFVSSKPKPNSHSALYWALFWIPYWKVHFTRSGPNIFFLLSNPSNISYLYIYLPIQYPSINHSCVNTHICKCSGYWYGCFLL